MDFKYNTKQRYKTIQGLRSFKDTLPTEAKRIISKKGKIYNETLDNWKYLVGKELFNICYPKSYKKSNIKGKSLNIMVKHGHEVGMFNHVNWIIGFPTETPLDFYHSLGLLYNCNEWIHNISPGVGCGIAPLTDLR